MNTSRAGSALAAALALLAASCGSGRGWQFPAPSSERPFPGYETRVTPSSTPPPPSSTPTRSKELQLSGVAPCEMLPRATWPQFDIVEAGHEIDIPPYVPSRGCIFHTPTKSWSFVLVTTEGMEVWREGKRMGKAHDIEPVLGFSTIAIRVPGLDEAGAQDCQVAVDVAAGQYVTTLFRSKGPKGAPETMCENARQLATVVVSTLLEKQ